MKPAEKMLSDQAAMLILDQPFFGALAMQLKRVSDPTIARASVDGKELRYNPKFIESLKPERVRTVLVQAILHCSLGHVWRRKHRTQKRWQLAGEFCVNGMLTEYNSVNLLKPPFPLAENDPHLPAFLNRAIEEVYSALPEEKEQSQSAQAKLSQGASGQSQGTPQPSQGSQQPPTPQNAPQGNVGAPQGIPEPGDHVPNVELKDTPEDEALTVQTDWQVAIEGAKHRGSVPGNLRHLIEELLNPSVPWQVLLRRFVSAYAKSDLSWARPNKRYMSAGIYLPSAHSPTIGTLAVVRDSSGSICPGECQLFTSEVQAILDDCQPEKLVLMDCDTEIAFRAEYTPGERIPLEMHGGGGTSFCAPIAAFEAEPPVALVYLTDLMGTFPPTAPSFPVLWVSTTSLEAPWGEVIQMKG